MRTKQIVISWVVSVMLIILTTSCATSVAVKVNKPSEIFMGDYRKLAVMDVAFPSLTNYASGYNRYQLTLLSYYGLADLHVNKEEKRIAGLLRDEILSTLIDSRYFQIYRPDDILQLVNADNAMASSLGGLAAMNQAVNPIDAFLVGEITGFKAKVDEIEEIEKQKNGDKIKVRKFKKNVSFDFTYRVLKNDGEMIAMRSFNREEEDVERQYDALESNEEIVSDMIRGIAAEIRKQLTPYTVTEYRTLMRDKTDNRELAEADKLVKEGVYAKALELYLSIYSRKKTLVAGYNAAILMEITGDIEGAIEFMTKVLDENPKREVKYELERMKRTKAEIEEAQSQM